MRHNNNSGRRFRGRNNNNGGGGNTHQSTGNYNSGGSNGNNNGGRRGNPRVQTFDSNGPDVRIRGNAYQINEKYVALARDAMSSGDRVQAESYLQHAEHYQRMINEMSEDYNRNNPPPQKQPVVTGDEPQPEVAVEQPGAAKAEAAAATKKIAAAEEAGLDDLDQSFLRPREKAVEPV